MNRIALAPALENEHRIAPVPRVMALALLVWWLLSFVDSAFEQAQMAIFANHIVAPQWSIDILMLAVIAWMIPQRGLRPLLPGTLMVAWLIFGACLVISALFLEARFDGVLKNLVITYYRFYFFVMALPFVTVLEGSFKTRSTEALLLLIAMPLGALGLYQYFKNDPILPTSSIGDTWQAFAWKLEDSVRAFSLFNSGWSFGHFMIFIGILSVFMAATRRLPAIVAVVLLGYCGFCVYVSLTRTAYVVGGAALATSVILLAARRLGRVNAIAVLPLLWGFVAYLVASGIKDFLHLLGVGRDSGVFSSVSLDARQEAWSQWTDVWFHDASNAFFGAAITQRDSGRLMSESTVLIDNVYIAIGAQIGAIGLLLWVFFIWQIWRFLLADAQRRDDALGWAIAAVWATWPLSLTFGSGGNYYALLALLALLTRQPRRPGAAVAADSVADQSAPAQFSQQRFRHQTMAGRADVGVVGQK